jgi:hypothetical protein
MCLVIIFILQLCQPTGRNRRNKKTANEKNEFIKSKKSAVEELSGVKVTIENKIEVIESQSGLPDKPSIPGVGDLSFRYLNCKPCCPFTPDAPKYSSYMIEYVKKTNATSDFIGLELTNEELEERMYIKCEINLLNSPYRQNRYKIFMLWRKSIIEYSRSLQCLHRDCDLVSLEKVGKRFTAFYTEKMKFGKVSSPADNSDQENLLFHW